MSDLATWQEVELRAVRVWEPGLFTLAFDWAPSFRAGQFCTVGMEIGGNVVKRAYSIASAPNRPLELFVVEVEGGALTPTLARLQPGDRVHVRPKIAGLFTLERVVPGGTLWLLATGTGLAPYLSMLREGSVWDRHEHVVLVHGVRTQAQLAYREELEGLARRRPFAYVPIVSREPVSDILCGRLTACLLSGNLEQRVGHVLRPEDSHVMLCGNPDMIDEMEHLLEARGLRVHTPSEPGQIHLERYW